MATPALFLERLEVEARIRARRNGEPARGAFDRELLEVANRLVSAMNELAQADAAIARARAQILAVDPRLLQALTATD